MARSRRDKNVGKLKKVGGGRNGYDTTDISRALLKVFRRT